MASNGVEKPPAADPPEHSSGQEEREKMLKSDAGTEGKMPQPLLAQKDAENGSTKKLSSAGSKEGDQVALIGPEQLEQYRKDPVWRGIRFAIFGLLILLFLGLVTTAVLLVALSGKCELEESELVAMPQNQTSRNTAQPLNPNVKPLHLVMPSGELAQFQCQSPSGHSTKWYKVGEDRLPPGASELADGTLQIVDANARHQGQYVCESANKFGNEDGMVQGSLYSEPVKLEVFAPKQENFSYLVLDTTTTAPPPSPASKPRVDSYMMVASAGDPVHFRCWQCQFAQCQTAHRLHWRKLQPVGQRQQMLVERDGQSAFLIFTTVGQLDAGVYECVDAETGVASSHVHLHVEPPRTPVIYPWEQSVPEGSPAHLRCEVPGHPDAELSWRLENGVEAARLYGVRDFGQGTLEIVAVRPEHERHGFVCWAVYPRRADKEALHAGPAKIYVLRREEKEEEGRLPNAVENMPRQNEDTNEPVPNHPPPESAAESEEPNEPNTGPVQNAPAPEDEEEGIENLNKAEEMPTKPLEEEEGSGEAIIRIEPLLDYVAGLATKMNNGTSYGDDNDGEQSGQDESEIGNGNGGEEAAEEDNDY